MSCNLSKALPWPALLEARQVLRQGSTGLAFCKSGDWRCQPSTDLSWQNADEVLLVDDDPKMLAQVTHARGYVSLYLIDERGLPRIESPTGVVFDSALATAARVYLPVLLGAAKAQLVTLEKISGAAERMAVAVEALAVEAVVVVES